MMTFAFYWIIFTLKKTNDERNIMLYLIALAVLMADQITKLMILSTLTPGAYLPVMPGVNLVLTYNKGISFSLLDNLGSMGPWILTAAALIICAGIVWYMHREKNTWVQVGFALILGGALGNMIDRMRFGGVVDFIDVYYRAWHWPAFNVADSAICLGAAWVVAAGLFSQKKNEKEKENTHA